MKDENRTKEDLIKELKSLRRTMTRLEKERHDAAAADSFLAGILDSLDDPVFVKDEEHRWVTLNAAACRLLGRKRETVVGRTDRELLSRRDAEAIARQDEEVLSAGNTVFSTDQFGPKKGQRTLATKKSLFIHPETGEKYIAGTIRDITRVKQTSEELAETAERLRILFEYAPDAYYLNDLKGRFMDGNRAAEELTGYKKDELVGKNFLKLNLIPASQLPRALRNLAKNAMGKPTGPDEFMLNRADGTRCTVEISTYPVKIKGETVVLGIARDISSRRAAENRLRDSEERYRSIVELAPDGIITINRAGFIVSCNEAAAAITGTTPAEVEGKHFTRLPTLRLQDLPRYTKIFASVLRGKVPPPMEVNWQHADGSDRVGEVHISLMRKKGRIAGLQIIFRDITDRKKADEERHELEENLYQSEKMQAIGQLAGGIAHDFNNQLGIIIGYAEILEDTLKGDEEGRRFLERILNAARRASGLTRQLLAYARKGHYQNVTVDVHKIIEEVMGLLEHTMDKRITMTSVLAADPPLVAGDPTQLQNALLNVALNARDAMPGGGQLKFSTANVVLDGSYCEKQPYKVIPGRYLQISIEDTGIGMTEEVRKRIFEPFFTTKEKSKGTGMGMAAVYGTVKGHKGSIEIVSAPEEGTLVMLFFPMAMEEENKEEKPSPFPAGTRAARILVVDDEDMVRTMTAELLRKLGHIPLAARDGVEGVEVFKKQKDEIDMVLLDMIMPRLNGYETLQQLQQIDPDVKVVLCSGYNMDTNTRAAIRDGALMFLQKPLSRSTLTQAIAEVLLDENEEPEDRNGS